MQISSWVLLGALAMASTVQASVLQVIPGEVQPVRRHHRFLRRQAPTNEAAAAKVHGEQKECTAAQSPQADQLQKQLPPNWKVASIVQGDDQANKVWSEIQKAGLTSGIQPKKGVQDNSGIDPSATKAYNVDQDPDCWWSATQCTKPKHHNIPTDLTTCSEPDTWGLSFDDGPNCTHNEFYDFMQKNKLRASLMYIGSNVVNWPYQAQRGLVDGHDICVHTWSHKYMTTLSDEQVFAELYYTIKAIKGVIGVTPRCWRPPFGDVDDRVRGIAAGLGLRTIVWAADTNDWNIQPVGQVPTSQIVKNYQSIIGMAQQSKSPMVLTHEINALTMEQFQNQYPKIKQAFKNVVPLTACVGATHPYPEDITYPSFKQLTSGNLKVEGLPNGKSMSIDPNPKFTPTPLSKQGQYSYFNPSQKGGNGSGNSGSGGSGGSGDSGSGGSTGSSGSSGSGGSGGSSGSGSNGGSPSGSTGSNNGSRSTPSNGASAGAHVQKALGVVTAVAAVCLTLTFI